MYVFFQRDTGKIFLTHQEVSPSGEALQITREELMGIANRAASLLDAKEALENVDVIEVDQESYLLRRVPAPEDRTEIYVDVHPLRKRTVIPLTAVAARITTLNTAS
jgi:hypothetical protein